MDFWSGFLVYYYVPLANHRGMYALRTLDVGVCSS